MILKLFIMTLCGVLMAIGGYKTLIARRYGLPIILTALMGYLTHDLWCLTALSACIALSLGYGDNSLFRRVFSDCWGRAIYSLIVGICLGIWTIFTGHISIFIFIGYLTACFFSEPLFKNLYQITGDFIIGCVFASIILLIHP